MNVLPWWLGNSDKWEHGFFISGVVFLTIWSFVWTGIALWHAARRQEKWWFIFFLFVHTAGILEIAYLVFVARLFDLPKTRTTKARKKK